MMKKFFAFFILSFLMISDLLACPYCVGSSQGGKDSNTTVVLATFVLSLYIPYFIIYRLIKKQRQLKEANEHSGSTQS